MNETDHTDDADGARMSRPPGAMNNDPGLGHEIKTTLPPDLFEEFLVASHSRGGRAAVTRDLIVFYLRGKTFAEHQAESRRAVLFGTGPNGRPLNGLTVGEK